MPGLFVANSDLLLVMPAFGQFASGVKPVQRCPLTCPAYRESGRGEWVERLMKAGALLTGYFHQINQDGRAQPAVDSDALQIQAIHECD